MIKDLTLKGLDEEGVNLTSNHPHSAFFSKLHFLEKG